MADLFWGFWADYPKSKIGNREYAVIGNRLYTRHAVKYFLPSGGRLSITQVTKSDPIVKAYAGGSSGGRSISPTFVEEVLQRGKSRPDKQHAHRTVYQLGDVEVVTEENAHIIVTISYRTRS